jgi:hypothetical protein
MLELSERRPNARGARAPALGRHAVQPANPIHIVIARREHAIQLATDIGKQFAWIGNGLQHGSEGFIAMKAPNADGRVVVGIFKKGELAPAELKDQGNAVAIGAA